MTRLKVEKLNFLLTAEPADNLLTSQQLEDHGISRKLAWWYCQAGWLAHVASGVYMRARASVIWANIPRTLQAELNLPLHVGGITALELLGKAHYVPMGFSQQEIQLFSPAGVRLPKWVNKSKFWNEQFKLFSTNLFLEDDSLTGTLITMEVDQIALLISSPERAALELCYCVPKKITFMETAECLENLSRLRPNLVQALLENCKNIKVKRLFLFLAEYYQHEWFNELDISQVELGSGKRSISGGGVYRKNFSISTPKLNEENDEDTTEIP